MNIGIALQNVIKSHVRSMPMIERAEFKKSALEFIRTIDDGLEIEPLSLQTFTQLINSQLASLDIGETQLLNLQGKTIRFARPYLSRESGKLQIKVKTKTLTNAHVNVTRTK